MKGKMRLLFWSGCFFVLVVAILVQIQNVVKARSMEKVTTFSIRNSEGIPVKTEVVEKGSFWIKERFSAKKTGNKSYDAEVPLELKERLRKMMKASSDNCMGEISRIGSSINYATGLFPVQIRTNKICKNDVEIFDVRIARLKGVFAIPTVSLQRKGKEYFVWGINSKGVAFKRDVQIAQKNGKLVYINKGLANNDQIVVHGATDLFENAKVKIIKK